MNVTDHARTTSPTTFDSSSVVTLTAAGANLHLAGDSLVKMGAGFSGAGQLTTENSIVITLEDGVDIGTLLVNSDSTMVLGNGRPAQVSTAHYTQGNAATLAVEILGLPGTTDWDQMTVVGNADLSGKLKVSFNAVGAQPGDTWKILDAGVLTGGFSVVEMSGLPVGTQLLKFEIASGVYLKLSAILTYASWAQSAGLVPANNATDLDPDFDQIENALEMFLGGDPLAPDFDLIPKPEIITVDNVEYLSLTYSLRFGSRRIPSSRSHSRGPLNAR